jgi:hypothetical protein
MRTESIVRVLAGALVLLSLALAYLSPWWLALAGFVGVNLIQSAVTGFCPAEIIIRKCQGSTMHRSIRRLPRASPQSPDQPNSSIKAPLMNTNRRC